MKMDAPQILKKAKLDKTGFETIRTKARNQKEVRLGRTDEPGSETETSQQRIQMLKSRSAEEPPQPSEEVSFIARLWGNFQELLGNR